VLTCTNLVFAAGLVLLATASGIAGLSLAWVVIGVGMGFGLYEAAFATVAGLYGSDARNAITGITLFAGFASTVGWPASSLFMDAVGWRGACLIWAAVHLAVGLPLNRFLVPKAFSPFVAHVTAASYLRCKCQAPDEESCHGLHFPDCGRDRAALHRRYGAGGHSP
jgi:hypothetical protein